DIDELGKNKFRIVLLNKSDLADPKQNKRWNEYFNNASVYVAEINSRTGAGVKSIQSLVQAACKDKSERDRKRGIVNRPIRSMVVGIPNVGKSTFINAYSGRNVAKAGNKPGVTVGKQWIKIDSNLELLDTPGILWPKFEDKNVGLNLAFLGSINDEILVTEELAGELLLFLKDNYPNLLKERYDLSEETCNTQNLDEYEQFATAQSVMMDYIAKKRGCLKQGASTDYFKVGGIILDDFRSGKIGKITLERP
ncbi:MAG: ribosome biogenesis GTPase YlqF, partial [Lachnospiraceae bacterium]|nr:ribosome biogenesis GTPase YlqF [Lachnospiraceae bacterium]